MPRGVGAGGGTVGSGGGRPGGREQVCIVTGKRVTTCPLLEGAPILETVCMYCVSCMYYVCIVHLLTWESMISFYLLPRSVVCMYVFCVMYVLSTY